MKNMFGILALTIFEFNQHLQKEIAHILIFKKVTLSKMCSVPPVMRCFLLSSLPVFFLLYNIPPVKDKLRHSLNSYR